MSDESCQCACGLRGCVSLAGRQHGFAATYRDGCRCSECTAAATDSTTRRHKLRNAKSRDTATRSGQQWTGPELDIAMRDDLTATQAAAMLGRTIRAVENARHLCRYDPKYINLLGASRIERAS